MRTAKLRIVFVALLSVSATAATAGVGTLSNVVVGEVAIISVPVGTPPQIHKPGNLNISIQGGFQPPAGVSCSDTNFLTTLAGVDTDGSMLQLLIAAVTSGQKVNLGITDDPQYNAFPGICSLMFVSLQKKP